MAPPSPSSRAQAATLLQAILDERRTLEEAVPRDADSFVRALLLSTLRHLGQIDALLKSYLETPPKREVQHALRLGVAQLLLLDIPAHAAVNETVELVKMSKHSALAGVVNAVLKRIAAEKPALPDVRHNLPGWLETRWKAQYGKEIADTICRVAGERPPLDLNAPGQSFTVGARFDEVIWRMGGNHPPVPDIDGYREGSFFIQDVAASYPVRLLGDVTGKRVLDIGAAPGGKTAQLARAGAQVIALDKSKTRMARLRDNMARLKLEVNIALADALDYVPNAPFDIVLLDAPCTATGTWRRHPEVVHILTPEDITELVELQRKLLARAWSWVKPGGTLIYCVCSLEREEGEDQRDWFLAQYKDAKEGETLRTTPAQMAEKGGMDGFYAALLGKN